MKYLKFRLQGLKGDDRGQRMSICRDRTMGPPPERRFRLAERSMCGGPS